MKNIVSGERINAIRGKLLQNSVLIHYHLKTVPACTICFSFT